MKMREKTGRSVPSGQREKRISRRKLLFGRVSVPFSIQSKNAFLLTEI